MRPVVVVLTCGVCGKLFTRLPSELRKGRGKSCSIPCAAQARLGTRHPNPKPKADRITLTCRQCVEPFTLTAGEARRSGKFCSVKCCNASKRTSVPRTCGVCSKAFTVKPSSVALGFGKFCSRSCANRAKTGVPTTPNKFGQPAKPMPSPPVRRPIPTNGPKQSDWDMHGGSMVRCAGPCQQLRPRGQMCPRCEYRAFEGVAS